MSIHNTEIVKSFDSKSMHSINIKTHPLNVLLVSV